MTNILRILFAFALMGAVAGAQESPVSVTITWLGHATFVMNTSTGLKVLLDPVNPGAYNPAPVDRIDVVTVSHEHPDHNYISLAKGAPLILRGLAENEFAKIDQTIKGVRIRTVASYHDNQEGAQRGKNALFVFELPGMRIAHLGDLGHKLTEEEVAEIGPVDILMTPVAGGPTIDPKTAVEVIKQLQAKVIIPMHYATETLIKNWGSGSKNNSQSMRAGEQGQDSMGRMGTGLMMSDVDEFLKELDPSIKKECPGHVVTFTSGNLPSTQTVFVMEYE